MVYMRSFRPVSLFLTSLLFLLSFPLAFAQRGERYALILSDPPVSGVVASRSELHSAQAEVHRSRVHNAQREVRRNLAARNMVITGSVDTVLNAVFVAAGPGHEAELRQIPGVVRVVRLRRVYPTLDRAAQLVNAPGGWAALGGTGNAGLGIKIAILDSGIDQTHPAFQDSSLPRVAGFPKCNGSDCDFTNSKVIVARSYIPMVAAGSNSANPAVDSKPDDVSPRDRVGHGTALAMVAAGNTATGPLATITGMAPKAYLGNYKIFGSPGVNDGTSEDAILTALEDAVNDGMDVIDISFGGPSFFSPLDQGQVCGLTGSSPCDIEAQAVENAIRSGVSIVASVGNDGDSSGGITLNSVGSPAIAPSAIAVGASTNSHQFVSTLSVSGGPAGLQQVNAIFGDGPLPPQPASAPAQDASQLGDTDGCNPFPKNSLSGTFVLVNSDNCNFSVKVNNAQSVGAVGVIMYLTDVEPLFQPGGLIDTTIPTVLISQADGQALISLAGNKTSQNVTLDPALRTIEVPSNNIASFSSRGPSTGLGAIKPEIVAVGTNVYMAAQRFDPNGELYSATGYAVADGTSFSAPMVAGAVALVKQKNSSFTPGQLKSAVVNTATQDVTEDDGSQSLVSAVGGGKLNIGNAVGATVTAEPATLSFGILQSGTQPVHQTIVITNTAANSVSLTLTLEATTKDSNGQLSLDKSQLTLGAHQSATVNVTLAGKLPNAGEYDGALVIRGAPMTVRVPYMYLVGDGRADNIFPLSGIDFDGNVGDQIPDGFISIKVVDQYGVPVPNLAATFTVRQGGGTLKNVDSRTDSNGIAGADAYLGPNPGNQTFRARAGGMSIDFTGIARLKPTISANGAVNAATFDVGAGVAPGSYITLFGTGLSDGTRGASTVSLPLSLSEVSVSFDVPGKVSVPGRLYYVSPTQVNLQVPWELQGQSSVQVKVSIQDSLGSVYTLPLAQYSPGLFQISDPGSGATIAAAEHLNRSVITAANPAKRGELIQLFMNGLGPVSNQPVTGEPAPGLPLAQTLATPTVNIGGASATVQFSGLTPGISGLYQVNVTVPPNAAVGASPIAVAIGGVAAKTVNLPVQ
jgi:minor extracellular serine protease Vpr